MRADPRLLLLVLAAPLSAKPVLELPWGSRPGEIGYWNATQPEFDEAMGLGPESIAIDIAGRIHVADTHAHRIQVFGMDGSLERVIAHPRIQLPGVISVTTDGSILVGLDREGLVAELSAEGALVKVWGRRRPGRPTSLFQQIGAIARDPSGRLVVADEASSTIFVVDEEDQVVRELPWPCTGMVLGSPGEILDLVHDEGSGYSVRARTVEGGERIVFRIPGAGRQGGRVMARTPDGGLWIRFIPEGTTGRMELVRFDATGRALQPVTDGTLLPSPATAAATATGELHWMDYDADVAPAGRFRIRSTPLPAGEPGTLGLKEPTGE